VYGLAKTRYFGSSEDVRKILLAASGDVEVMVHFPYDARGNALQRDQLKAEIENWTWTNKLASYKCL
jgi:hypothetical protein